MAAGKSKDDTPSLPRLLADSLAFLIRKRAAFFTVVLPIALIAAGIAWLLDTQRLFTDWRGHWAWDFLFVLIYAMFLDRWIKESLLDGASDCDEVDLLRRSIVTPRFLGFAAMLFAIAAALSILPWVVPLILCTVIFALLALALPSFSAATPLGLWQALRLGRSARTKLIVLGVAVALLSVADDSAAHLALHHLPKQVWAGPLVAAGQRIADCALIAIAGHVLASLFLHLADWRQPEPADQAWRDETWAQRKASSR